jgi:hypothetical protein
MEDILTIEVPGGLSEEVLKELESTISGLEPVKKVGHTSGDRSLDPASLMLWMELIGGALTVVATAVPLIEKIVGMFRNKKISGVKISMPDGTAVSVDDCTSDDIRKLISNNKE